MSVNIHDRTHAIGVVVHENAALRSQLSDMLRKSGLEPLVFCRAEAALAAMTAVSEKPGETMGTLPALIVTDLSMPDIDGWRFCRLLRSPEYKALNRIPILVVSNTFHGDEVSRIAADLGVEGFLPLPASEDLFSERVRAILEGRQVRTSLRVLIVDDDAGLCEVMEEIFQSSGYVAEKASTFHDAVESFNKAEFDVAVIDYHLPGGSGATLLDVFQTRRPDCVCLMLTGDSDPNLALKWMKQGAAAYVQKPFQPGYLIELSAKARRERTLLRALDLLEVRTRELRESELRFRSLLHSVPSLAVQGCSPEGVIRYWNQASEQLYGYSTREAVGRNLVDLLVPPERREDARSLIRQMAATGQPIPASELSLLRKDGSYATVFSNYAVVRIPGQPQELFRIDVDMTERKRADAEREKMEAQNRQIQKAESLSRMAGAIAHHFNNQLQTVMMGLDLAAKELPSTTGTLKILDDAMLSARKAAEVSGLMLTYLGQTLARQETLDLAETCLKCLPMLRAAMPKHHVMETSLSVPGPTILGNASQIQQVLTNLVANAWEAASEDRRPIRLAVKTAVVADIPCTNRFPLDYPLEGRACACLEVADSGCGIPERDFEKLFEPFYSSKFAGRGLGLCVVLGIVRSHHGVVTVESAPGRGSVFRVYFPILTEYAATKSIPASSPAPAKADGATLLLVDDEPNLLNMLATALSCYGYKVLTAQNGPEAVEIFRRHINEISLVLCDLTMPRMDGWDTLSAMRKLSPDIPVILSSGYSEAQAMEGEHSEMPQAFLRKPYELKTLCGTVSRLLTSEARFGRQLPGQTDGGDHA